MAEAGLAALEIDGLDESVLAVLANIAAARVAGQDIPAGWLRSLRTRVSRYHNVRI